jgi:hypothetical protein
MNRRLMLSLIGLAPVAAMVPALAQVQRVRRGGRPLSVAEITTIAHTGVFGGNTLDETSPLLIRCRAIVDQHQRDLDGVAERDNPDWDVRSTYRNLSV